MRVLWFLRGGIHETWVRCCVLRLEVLDRFKVGGVGHDFRELLQLLELIQFRFLFFGDSSAHGESSIWVSRKTYASNKYRQSKSVRTVDDRCVHAQMSALVERPYSLAETVDRD